MQIITDQFYDIKTVANEIEINKVLLQFKSCRFGSSF